MPKHLRQTYSIIGIVQGVGFRPAMHSYARSLDLGGWVQNKSGTVQLMIEGAEEAVQKFGEGLKDAFPRQAVVQTVKLVEEVELSSAPAAEFRILPSQSDSSFCLAFPPDLALCHECLADISRPESRFYRYPFTTCTNCGPRYTVINGLPYDRERTTLREFPLCADCRRDYEDMRGRRFHAESIACPACGPRLTLSDNSGRLLDLQDPLGACRKALAAGKIAALRGIGGYLLAADACNASAISLLRSRKTRRHKPLAVMARNLAVVKRWCEVSPVEEQALLSAESPIVILDLKRERPAALQTQLLSADSATLGVMLPNSPLHWLLLNALPADETPPFEFLVMTSGNRGGEPICLTPLEAQERLGGIADLFLNHNREINLRADDSLAIEQRGRLQLWRRGRGYAPGRVTVKHKLGRCVLAMGAELKNTLALGSGHEIIISAHIGDMETPEALQSLEQVAECFPLFSRKVPEVIAVDLHPDMQATRLGKKLAARLDLPLITVQHHYAHAAGVLAEHQLEECLVLVFDGTGLGTDGKVWGAELLHARLDGYSRLASFAPVPLPGGDAAVSEPVRQLCARLAAAGLELPEPLRVHYAVSDEELSAWRAQAVRGINSPSSHAAGRLFDSVAALLELSPRRTTYDGQAAILVEAEAWKYTNRNQNELLPYALQEGPEMLLIDWAPMFKELSSRIIGGSGRPGLAYSFHRTVAEAAVNMAEYGLSRFPARRVALSGGVFMNRLLTKLLAELLEGLGLEVLCNYSVPPNDGGISVGQALIGGSTNSSHYN